MVASKKASQEDVASALTGTEIVRVVQGGHTKRTTTAAIAALSSVAGNPAGNDTYVQFNDGGSFGADATFVFNKTTKLLSVAALATSTFVCPSAAAAAYTLANSGLVFKTPAGDEIGRIWMTDPDYNNFNSFNLYVGHQAGYSQPADNVSAGYSNVGIGVFALYSNGTGFINVAVGDSALYSCVSGHSNVAVGPSAGYDLTTGNTNTFVGTSAGRYMATGIRNVAIGSNAFGGGDAATDNVAVGQAAVGTNGGTGDILGNVGVGKSAAGNLTTGNYNTALGWCAGRYLTTGGFNVHIGCEAGVDGANAITGTGQVIIGSVCAPQATSDSNEIAIGYQATGKGPNTAAIGNGSVADVWFGNGDASLHAAMLQGSEVSEPVAPAANGWKLFAKDNGGKTQLMVRFATGASQQLAIEP